VQLRFNVRHVFVTVAHVAAFSKGVECDAMLLSLRHCAVAGLE
jgi:hypothetical protein